MNNYYNTSLTHSNCTWVIKTENSLVAIFAKIPCTIAHDLVLNF